MPARLVAVLATASVLVLPALAAEPADPGAPEPRARVGVALLASSWDGLGDRVPDFPGTTPDQVGAFETDGLGFDLTWYRLLQRGRGWRTWVGLDVGGSLFDNRERYVLVNALTGERIEGRLEASLGSLGGGVRWVRGRGRLRLVLGAGAGLYLFRVQERLEDFGYVDTGYDDEGPGGYGLLGVEYRFRPPVLLRVEAKVHGFDLGDPDGLFAGESPGGSLTTLGVGVDFQFGRPR